MAESTEMVVRRFAQVIDMSLQIKGLVMVDAQCGNCIREIYNRACNIDGRYVWKYAEPLLSTKQNSIRF